MKENNIIRFLGATLEEGSFSRIDWGEDRLSLFDKRGNEIYYEDREKDNFWYKKEYSAKDIVIYSEDCTGVKKKFDEDGKIFYYESRLYGVWEKVEKKPF